MENIDYVKEYSEEITRLLRGDFGIALNANDFFCYASADMVLVDYRDFGWVLPIYRKFGQPGLDACLSHIAGRDPIEPYLTDEFYKARAAIKELNPDVKSEY